MPWRGLCSVRFRNDLSPQVVLPCHVVAPVPKPKPNRGRYHETAARRRPRAASHHGEPQPSPERPSRALQWFTRVVHFLLHQSAGPNTHCSPQTAELRRASAAPPRVWSPEAARPRPRARNVSEPTDLDPTACVNPCRVKRRSVPVNARYFAKEPLRFTGINPQSRHIQKYFQFSPVLVI